MSGFESYTATRQAEDIVDDVYIIDPVDNPICSMARTIQATGKNHEWSEDDLAALKKNANVEGAAAGADTSTAMTELNNYCQIFSEVAEITGTLEVVDKYARDSEMSYQLEKRYMEMARDEESAVVGDAGGTGRQTAVAGNASTAREMASLHAQLDASVIKYATVDGLIGGVAITTIAELETILLEAHLATYNAGGNPGYAVTDPESAAYFAGFALSSGRNRDVMETTLVNVIDLYQSTYGRLDVVLNRSQNQTDQAIVLYDPNYAATPVLRPTHDYAIAKAGDSDKRQVIRESTFAVLNTRAHAVVDLVPSGLT